MAEINKEIQAQNQRIYKISDVLTEHGKTLVEHTTIIGMLNQEIKILSSTAVNRDLLNATVGTALLKIESMHSENSLKFAHISQQIEPIRKAISWAAYTVVGAVIIALLTLVLKSAGS